MMNHSTHTKIVFSLCLGWALSASLLAQQPVGPVDAGTPSRSPAPKGATLPAGTPSATPVPLAPNGGPAMIGGDVVRGGVRIPSRKPAPIRRTSRP